MAKMCIYCEECSYDSERFYCRSRGEKRPNFAKFKTLGNLFGEKCSKADENGWQKQCSQFICPEVVMEQNGSGQPAGRTRQRASDRMRERMAYLEGLSDGMRQGVMLNAQAPIPPADMQNGIGQGQQESSLAGDLLKAGAKAAIDIGKTMANPIGAGTDTVADAAKRLIDEL